MDEGILPDAFEMEWLVWYTSAAVFMIILTAIHSYNVALDFLTEERKCLNHRSRKPKLTKQYKFVQYLTLVVLNCYSLSALLFAIEMASYTWPLQVCINLNNAGGWFLLIGKGCMYLLFMYRLHICYQTSAYGYSKRLILIIGWCNVAFGIIVEAITTYMTDRYWVYFADYDGFPNPCFPIVSEGDWTVQYFPTTMMAWDFSMNVLSLYLFINPLRKAFKGVGRDQKESSMSKSMLYIAIKYTVLSAVASLSTSFFWICVNWIMPMAYYVVSFDVVVNSICVMLMTAYYPDQLYYERVCCCCLRVFVPNKLRWKQLKTEKELGSMFKTSVATGTGTIDPSSQTGTATGTIPPKEMESQQTPPEEIEIQVTPPEEVPQSQIE